MSDAAAAQERPPAEPQAAERPAARPPSGIISELRVTGHLMTLEAGLFCIVQKPSKAGDTATGLPGVRVSLPPGREGRPDAVSIATFRPDGWLSGLGDAALVRIAGGAAQVLVTVYQAPGATDGAPNLQVMRLGDSPAAATAARPAAAAAPAAPKVMDMVAHIQGRGDVGAVLGDWLGEIGSKRWIEGFAVAPTSDVTPSDLEYQAVLGRGWLSPWVEGGQFCGSRGMALPVLGLKLRLRGAAATAFECSYTAAFVDGSTVGPVQAGEACESESLAPLEAMRIEIRPIGTAALPDPAANDPAARAVRAPAAKPAVARPKPPGQRS